MVEARSDARLLCSSVGTGGQGVGEGEKKETFSLNINDLPDKLSKNWEIR